MNFCQINRNLTTDFSEYFFFPDVKLSIQYLCPKFKLLNFFLNRKLFICTNKQVEMQMLQRLTLFLAFSDPLHENLKKCVRKIPMPAVIFTVFSLSYHCALQGQMMKDSHQFISVGEEKEVLNSIRSYTEWSL